MNRLDTDTRTLLHHHPWKFPIMTLVMTLVLALPLNAFAATPIPREDQEIIRQAILENYVIEIDPARLENMTVESLGALLDENSTYIPRQAMRQLMDDYQGEYEGIGAYVMLSGDRIVIAEPMAGSPAEAAGLQSGDQVLAVDGIPLEGKTVQEAVALIKGPSGTQVVLTIQRAGMNPMQVSVTRRAITVSSIRTRTFDDDIGYLQVQQFADHTAENAQYAMENFRAKGVDKLIIDLRGNPGGLLIEGVDFSRLFIPRGPIVHVLYRDGIITYSSYLGEKPFEQLVVLVDNHTASAAEIFTAAFRDTNLGIIVGENTYGKGSVQRIYSLPSGAGFKLTEAVYVSPEYTTIDGVGIAPSINMLRFHPDHDPNNLLPLDITRKPALGMRGHDIAAAQQRLNNMGYPITDPPGVFGATTYQAVKDFQTDQGIFSYGVLDFSTQRRLERAYITWLLAPEQDLQLSTALYYLRGHRASHQGAEPIPYGTMQLP